MTETIEPAAAEKTEHVTFVVAEYMKETGRCDFTYLGDPSIREAHRDLLALPWGYAWKSTGGGVSFNVFHKGELKVGGGFEERAADPELKGHTEMMLKALPTCSILCSSETFAWLKENVLEVEELDHRPQFKSHHLEKASTSNHEWQ